MGKIFKNLAPYWKSVIVIVLFLVLQAYADLALPQYTSSIIDTGIQNGGVEHILPEQIKKDEFKEASIFMTDKEKDIWENAYEVKGDVNKSKGDLYILKDYDKEQLDEMDKELMTSIVLTYQLGHMSEADFKDTVKSSMEKNPAMAPMADKIDDMSISDIEELMHTDITSFKAKDEDGNQATYVDMRPLMEQMISSGQIDDKMIEDNRQKMEETISAIGDDTLKSMGVAYAVDCMDKTGMDMDDVQMSYLWSEGGRMFIMAFLSLFAAIVVSYFASRAGAGVGRDLRGKVFKNVIGFSNTEMDNFSTASLITRSTNDVQQIQMVSILMLRMVLFAPIMGLGGVYKVWKTGANMGWVIGLALLVILGFVGLLVSITMPKFKVMQKLVDALNLVSREILTGLSVIRAFGREKTEEERFDVANNNLKRTQLFTNRVMSCMMPGMMLIMYCLVIGITWVSAHRIDTGDLQVGAMTAFISYSMQIVMSFLMLTMMSIMLPRAGVAAERIDEVIRTQSSLLDAEETKQLTEHKGVLKFDHVSFRYPGADEDVIHDIDFTAEPGKVTAIIGSTGAGKSTLVNLIPRFYDVTEGSITLDGVDVRDLSMKDLRDDIGFVPQKGVLFSGTIASNLRFGNKDASDEEVSKAAEIAQATEFIEGKHESFDASISQGGTNVSGGQKQRLAIARAIAKNPKVFVFDDSFSALDMKTDAKLRHALDESVHDCTEVIVAQRISTILHADQILVLDEGEVVGKGTHEELLKSCEVYQQIASSQLSEKELAAMTVASEKGGVHHE